MPDRRIGVAILSNGGAAGSLVADVVATYVYDRVLEKPRADGRVTQLAGEIERIRGRLAKDAATRAARPQTTPLPLSAYAGTYISPALGTMVWTLENGRLKVRIGLAVGDVEVYDGARFQLRVTLLGGGSVVTFNVPPNGDRPTSLMLLNHTFTRVELPRVPPA